MAKYNAGEIFALRNFRDSQNGSIVKISNVIASDVYRVKYLKHSPKADKLKTSVVGPEHLVPAKYDPKKESEKKRRIVRSHRTVNKGKAVKQHAGKGRKPGNKKGHK